MKVNHVTTLIGQTFRKEYQSKTLFFLFLTTIIIITLFNFLMDFAADLIPTSMGQGEEAAGMEIGQAIIGHKFSIFYFGIQMWAGIVAVIFGIRSIKSDFEENVIGQLLSFPVNRFTYMASRIFGSWLIVLSYFLLSLVFAVFIFYVVGKGLSLNWNLVPAMALSSLSLLAIVSMSALLSLLFGSVVSFLFSFLSISFIYFSALAHRGSEFMEALKEFGSFGLFKKIAFAIYSIFPRSANLNEMSIQMLGDGEIRMAVPFEISHFVFTMVLLIGALFLRFRRMEP